MTKPLHTSRQLIVAHALALIEWNHAEFVPGLLGGKPNMVVTPQILAVFEGGGLARFREVAGRFRLLFTAQFEPGNRIEVNQHQVVMTKTRTEMRGQGATATRAWIIDRTNEMASGIILMKSDGSMVQLVDWMLRDDLKAANEAVRLRQLLGAGEPPRPPRDEREGFTL